MVPVEDEVPDSALETLKGIFNELFAPYKVAEVIAENDESWDGDALVKIYIVFEYLPGDDGLPDMKKAFGMHRKVIPVLEEAGVTRWPYFSFTTKHELYHESA